MSDTVIIEDAYYPCCGQQFRSKEALLRHKIGNAPEHRDELLKHLRRESLLWHFVYSRGLHADAKCYVEEKEAEGGGHERN